VALPENILINDKFMSCILDYTEVQFYDFMSGMPGIGVIPGIYQTMP